MVYYGISNNIGNWKQKRVFASDSNFLSETSNSDKHIYQEEEIFDVTFWIRFRIIWIGYSDFGCQSY